MMLQIRRSRQLIIFLFLLPIVLSFGDEESETVPSYFAVSGVPWTGQVWNNCGPANLAQVMNYWGWDGNQFDIESVIRPNQNDPHVGIAELAGFARSAGLDVHVLEYADMHDLKSAVSSGKPVLVPTWHVDGDGEQMGHYRTVYGYDDNVSVVFIRDTLEGPDVVMAYSDFKHLWAVFDCRILIVSSGTEPEPDPKWNGEFQVSGSVPLLTNLPNKEQATALELFAKGVEAYALGNPERAVAMIELSRSRYLPWRIWWYRPEALAAYISLGQFHTVLDITGKALRSYPYSEELFYWRARAFDGMGESGKALEALSESNELRAGWLDPGLLNPFSKSVEEGFPSIGLVFD